MTITITTLAEVESARTVEAEASRVFKATGAGLASYNDAYYVRVSKELAYFAAVAAKADEAEEEAEDKAESCDICAQGGVSTPNAPGRGQPVETICGFQPKFPRRMRVCESCWTMMSPQRKEELAETE